METPARCKQRELYRHGRNQYAITIAAQNSTTVGYEAKLGGEAVSTQLLAHSIQACNNTVGSA